MQRTLARTPTAPPPGFEPGPNSSKGCRAAVTLRRNSRPTRKTVDRDNSARCAPPLEPHAWAGLAGGRPPPACAPPAGAPPAGAPPAGAPPAGAPPAGAPPAGGPPAGGPKRRRCTTRRGVSRRMTAFRGESPAFLGGADSAKHPRDAPHLTVALSQMQETL